MRWEAFCRALGRRFDVPPPQIHPLDPPPESARELAEAARKLLQDPVFRLAMEGVEQGITERWRRSKVGEREQREILFLLHTTLDELRNELGLMAAGIHQKAA